MKKILLPCTPWCHTRLTVATHPPNLLSHYDWQCPPTQLSHTTTSGHPHTQPIENDEWQCPYTLLSHTPYRVHPVCCHTWLTVPTHTLLSHQLTVPTHALNLSKMTTDSVHPTCCLTRLTESTHPVVSHDIRCPPTPYCHTQPTHQPCGDNRLTFPSYYSGS